VFVELSEALVELQDARIRRTRRRGLVAQRDQDVFDFGIARRELHILLIRVPCILTPSDDVGELGERDPLIGIVG
jgi:hypothetical protein